MLKKNSLSRTLLPEIYCTPNFLTSAVAHYRHPVEWRTLLPSAWETEGLKKEFAISQELHNLMEENAS